MSDDTQTKFSDSSINSTSQTDLSQTTENSSVNIQPTVDESIPANSDTITKLIFPQGKGLPDFLPYDCITLVIQKLAPEDQLKLSRCSRKNEYSKYAQTIFRRDLDLYETNHSDYTCDRLKVFLDALKYHPGSPFGDKNPNPLPPALKEYAELLKPKVDSSYTCDITDSAQAKLNNLAINDDSDQSLKQDSRPIYIRDLRQDQREQFAKSLLTQKTIPGSYVANLKQCRDVSLDFQSRDDMLREYSDFGVLWREHDELEDIFPNLKWNEDLRLWTAGCDPSSQCFIDSIEKNFIPEAAKNRFKYPNLVRLGSSKKKVG